jgi:hypothetical protein
MSAQYPRVSGEDQRQPLPLEPGEARAWLRTSPKWAARREGPAAAVAGGAVAADPGRTPGSG